LAFAISELQAGEDRSEGGSLMKAHQVKASVNNEPLLIPTHCLMCEKKTHPFGFVDQGRGIVCSRACDNAYEEKMYAQRVSKV
jgi:hypothetical protein